MGAGARLRRKSGLLATYGINSPILLASWNATMPGDDTVLFPMIEIAIEPKTKADQQKLGDALAALAADDPSFVVSTDRESGQTILKGTSELHLDAKVGQLERD